MAGKAKILVIDDEEDICCFTKSILEKSGKFEVLVSSDALEGIVLAKSRQPDLILLDIHMPKMDGALVAENLLTDVSTNKIPVVFLTALLEKSEADDRIGKIGDHFFIAKPVDPKELIKRIEEILKIQDLKSFGV